MPNAATTDVENSPTTISRALIESARPVPSIDARNADPQDLP